MSTNDAAGAKLSYLERLQRLRAQNERRRVALGAGQNATDVGTSKEGEERRRKQEEEEGDGGKENLDQVLHDLRLNKSAPAGDTSALSTSADGGARCVSMVVDAGDGSPSVKNNNLSGGSSVIDVPREEQASVLSALSQAGNGTHLESFSVPVVPSTVSTATEAASQIRPVEGKASDLRGDRGFVQPMAKGTTNAVLENVERLPEVPVVPAVDRVDGRQRNGSISDSIREEERQPRASLAMGSVVRSRSAASTQSAEQYQLVTPLLARSKSVLARTPAAMMQTPSMHRSSFSSVNLSTTQQRIVVNEKSYVVLNQLGKGGSSKVFQAFDEELGRTVAIKVVDLSEADDIARTAFINECVTLKRFEGSRHVIAMYDYELREDEEALYVVMEKGDTDLATYLRTKRHEMSTTFVRFWWEEMLRAVKVVHDHKIVHSDLKPANFLLVAGSLRLIDFGIAASIPANKTSVVKDSQMGTLSYMSPESLQAVDEMGDRSMNSSSSAGFKMTHKSDVWSLGCILYNMVYGRTPFEHVRNQIAKMRAICDPKYPIPFEAAADSQVVDVLKKCLERDVTKRASVDELLDHPYLAANRQGSSSSSSSCQGSSATSTSPLTDDKLAQIAVKLQSYTPRTATRKLKEVVEQARKGGGAGTAANKCVLNFESPPSTK